MEKKYGTLIKTYLGSRETEQGQKYDTLTLIYRDENGDKKTIYYDRPPVDYWVLKDKNSPEATNPPMYITVDKVTHYTTYSDNLYRDVATNTGATSYYNKIKFNYGPNSYNMKNLLKSPLLYGADVAIEDQYVAKFYQEFEPVPTYKLHKCYFDIENDIYHYNGGVPDTSETPCPICLVTLIDEKAMQSHTFVLRNSKNTGLVEFEKDVDEFKTYMHNKILDADNLDMEFLFYFYDDELDMIKGFFDKVHELSPDFCSGWNISYDCPYLQNRAKNLFRADKARRGEMTAADAAAQLVCDDNYLIQTNNAGKQFYLSPYAYYSKGMGKFGSRIDDYKILDGTYWADQMLIYANIHAGEGKPDNYKLDTIANKLLGKEKLPFGPGETIRNQLYVNTKRFIEYNIRDVILLLEIEDNTQDLDKIQRLADITVTRKSKCTKKSYSVTNFVNKFANEQGLVMRTNKNTSYGTDEESSFYNNMFLMLNDIVETDDRYRKLFDIKDKYGAYVSSPELNDTVGMELFRGKFSMYLFELVCDFDFSSLYPSIIRAFNLDSGNIDGKFYVMDEDIKQKIISKYHCPEMFYYSIKGKKTDDDDDDDDVDDIIEGKPSKVNETDDLNSALADALQSRDYNKIGNIFLDLPSTADLITKLRERKK